MKVYVIYDPLTEKILCVHQYPNTECPECKDIREERKKIYHLEEIEREVFNDAKTYDAPAIISECVSDDRELFPDRKEENICSADEEDIQPDLCCGLYYNPKSGKTQKLFDNLKPVWTVCYRNHEVGWKGEAVYITLEAHSNEHAKHEAMLNREFTKHIEMKYYNKKCLKAYKPSGNYVIGKVDYYEGDERL